MTESEKKSLKLGDGRLSNTFQNSRKSHKFGKENHLNQTFMTLGSMLIFRGVYAQNVPHDPDSSLKCDSLKR